MGDLKVERPVLSAIRAILEFKNSATIADVARMTGMKQRAVLDVLNRNGYMVWRVRSSGKITKVDTKSVLANKLWASGAYYRQDVYGEWAPEGKHLQWIGRSDLRESLETKRYPENVVLDTPENRAAVEASGLRPWSEAVIDDSLWVEAEATRASQSPPPGGEREE